MTHNSNQSNPRFIGTFTLIMLSVSAIISLRNLPTTALTGSKAIFFFTIAGLLFLIPVALCCAELASGWPKKGGIYSWVKEAYGPKWGLIAIWLEWVESVVWLPTVLSFMAATTAYLLNPAWVQNKMFLISFMYAYLWGSTILNFKGMRVSSWISTIGVIIGSFIPAFLLIFLGFKYYLQASNSAPSLISFSMESIIPTGNINTFVTFTAILLGLCGMEIPAYYIQNVKNPKKTYPRATIIAAIIILAISIMGSLAISAVIPHNEIDLVSGPMQAFKIFFKKLNIEWALPALASFTLIGGIAILNTWIISPSKGLLASAKAGDLPIWLTYTNKKDVPVALLMLQGTVASIIIFIFVFSPSIDLIYWMINILAAQLYLMMYFLLFISVIRLRYLQPNKPRTYQVPGGKVGIWIIAGGSALTCVAAIIIGFIIPANLPVHLTQVKYALCLLIGIGICLVPPFLFLLFKKNPTTLS